MCGLTSGLSVLSQWPVCPFCVPVPYCSNYCSFFGVLKSGTLMPLAVFFLLKIAFSRFSVISFKVKAVFTSYLKDVIDVLIGNVLNL